MDELINSIVDIKAIEAERDKVLTAISDIEKRMSTVSDNVKKISDATRAAQNGNDLSKNSKALNDEIAKGTKIVTEYGAAQKQLEAQEAKIIQLRGQTVSVTSNENKEIINLNRSVSEANKILKLQSVLTDENAGKQEKLKAEIALLRIQKDKLKEGDKDYAATIEALNDKINKNTEELKKNNDSEQARTQGIGEYKKQLGDLITGLKTGSITTKEFSSSILTLGKNMVKAFITNPIFLTLAAIVIVIKGIVDAIGQSEERTNKLNAAMANFKPVLKLIGDGFELLADGVIKTVEVFGKAFAAVSRFLNIDPKSNSDKFVEAEKLKQEAVLKTRKLNEDAIEQEAIISDQRAILTDKENYTFKEREAAFKLAAEAEKKFAADKQQIAEMNLKALEAEAALDDNNAEMNEKLSAAVIAVSAARKESNTILIKLNKERAKLIRENNADEKAAADAAKAIQDKKIADEKAAEKLIIDSRRRLIDSQLALLSEGEEKQIAISEESFNRQLEDLKASGQLTEELKKNLETAHGTEVQKIRDDFAKQRKEKDAAELDKYIADFEKNLQKEVDLLSAGYREKETELKNQYATGKIDRKKYEAELIKIQSDAAKEANDKSIEILQKELEIADLSADKKAEISAKIRDLQIENENAVLDATIKTNEEKVQSDKDTLEKRLEIAFKLADVANEIFGAIADFQRQESEKRLEEIDAEKQKSDESFAAREENMKNSIMSDENRAETQKKIDQEKAKRDKEYNDKVKAEKIKQAKWDKAQGLTSAIIGTAKAVVEAWGAGPILGPILAVLAGIAGGIQIAKIASQQIPAYSTGIESTPKGLALWGEKRPEVAVTPRGEIMFAEKPTISNFDAGTKIFKSVEDYEKHMMQKGAKNFEFDYDQMAAKMPSTNINLDSTGLWNVINKQGERTRMINRRHKLC